MKLSCKSKKFLQIIKNNHINYIMTEIILPNGDKRKFEDGINGIDCAQQIAKSLGKSAIAMRINGDIWDLSRVIPDGARVEFITREDDDAMEILRHDCAHILAQAVQELYPHTQITFGPAIENGFYYDFVRETPFSIDDFAKIEARMAQIVDRNEAFVREVWQRDDAIAYFTKIGEVYKAEHIKTLPEDAEITIYKQGEWLDLCRGPHLPSVGKLGKAFKLMKLSGAYWRGDKNNQQLQRMYGTIWRNDAELAQYLTQLAEAERRDHRKLGKQMDLFHIQEEATGSVFWHPNGWKIWTIIEQYMRQKQAENGYVEVKTPQLVDRHLWEMSGHWDKYRENMFITEVDEGGDDKDQNEKRIMALKPMNCPCHVQIFRQGLRSYRDLPLRMAEFGACHRYEPSGALHGIMRVRAFTQDDAHIFCTEDQIVAECQKFNEFLLAVYHDFGFYDVRVKLSTRPEKYAGSLEIWNKAEETLKNAIEESGIAYTIFAGEGAFYGPKLEYVLRDAIGRDWQCGTFQVDFVLPERLDALFVASDGERKRPVMLHRAILGSFERFIGILIENYAGRLPFWLAPMQIIVATITSSADEYGQKIVDLLTAKGYRAAIDCRNEKINYKVREHSTKFVPVLFVVGEKEAQNNEISVRQLGSMANENMSVDSAIELVYKLQLSKK